MALMMGQRIVRLVCLVSLIAVASRMIPAIILRTAIVDAKNQVNYIGLSFWENVPYCKTKFYETNNLKNHDAILFLKDLLLVRI